MKICPNCHTQLTDDVKFCTKCGAFVGNVQDHAVVEQEIAENTTVQPAPQTRSTPDAGNFIKGYWDFLLGSLKRPMKYDTADSHQYFGLTSYILLALINTLTYFAVVKTMGNWIFKVTDPTDGRLVADISLTKIPLAKSALNIMISQYITSTYFTVFISIIGTLAVIILVSFIAVKGIMKSDIGIMDFMNQTAGYSSSALVVALISLLLVIPGFNVTKTYILALLGLEALIVLIGVLTALFTYENHSKLDFVYILIIVAAICIVAFEFISGYAGHQIGKAFANGFQSLEYGSLSSAIESILGNQ